MNALLRRPLVTSTVVLLLAFALAGVGGCATKRQTETVTETLEYPAGSTLPDGQIAEEDMQVRVTRETTTVTEKEGFCGGPIGCTAKVTWEIIKLPFRIVFFIVDVILL